MNELLEQTDWRDQDKIEQDGTVAVRMEWTELKYLI